MENRFLHNADCNAMFYNPGQWQPDGGPYSAGALRRYVDQAADTGFDTLLYNPNVQVPLYPSRALRHWLMGYARGDESFFRQSSSDKARRMVQMADLYLDLEEAGVDLLAEIAAACRSRGMAPWLSIRMNDMHGWRDPEEPRNCDLFRDPQFRLSGRMPNPDASGPEIRLQAGLNYERKEVRDYFYELIREAVEKYDYEGMELDWLRGPRCCEPDPSQSTLDTITAWHADIRRLTQAHAEKKGRPFRLGMRVLGDLGQMRSIGIDVEAMAREGLLDFVSAGNIHQASWDIPFDRLRSQLGDKIRLYGVINTEPNKLPCYDPRTEARALRRLHTSREAVWANAAGKLALGADGLETFNFFFQRDPTRPEQEQEAYFKFFQGIANLEALRGRPKQYCFSTMGSDTAIAPHDDVVAQLPQLLRPRWRRQFRLPMCREPEDSKRDLIIQVAVEDQEQLLRLGVSFNGSWPNFEAVATRELHYPAVSRQSGDTRLKEGDVVLTHYLPEHRAFNYRFPASSIREGWNDITLYYGGADPARGHALERENPPVCVVGIELAVR